MANQTIPVTLTPGTLPPTTGQLSIQQLLVLFCANIAGAIRADITFILTAIFDPTTFQTDLIFNKTQQVFKAWNTGAGRYQTITENQIGDIKESVSGADQVSSGWVVCNGRAISAVPGLTQAQISTLETLFGANGNLPAITPMNGGGLPAADSFSGIADVTVTPTKATIDALAVGATYDQTEVEAIRDAAGDLSDSTNNVETQVQAIRDKCNDFLTAVRANNAPPLYALVFAGYP